MAWAGGFTGESFNREEFRAWLSKQKKPPYVRTVAHNTDAPYMIPPVPGRTRIFNLAHYYKTPAKGKRPWTAGPDFFVFGGEDRVYLGSPLGKSIGCSGWNGNSMHCEAEGKYTKASGQDPTVEGSVAAQVWDTMAWVFAEFHDWMQMPVDQGHLKFHKEGNTTHKTCPGGLVEKEWFMDKVNKASANPKPTPPKAPEPYPRWVNTPNDRLNVRQGGSAGADIVGKVPHALKVMVYQTLGNWAKVKTPAGYLGWVNMTYLADKDPKTVPVPPKPAPKPDPRPEPKYPRAKKAFEFYTGKGLPAFKAAAIVGRLQRESFPDLRTDVWGDSHTAYGIGQWRMHRLDNLKRFAASRNTPISDFDTQLEFVLWEFDPGNNADIGKLHYQTMDGASTLEDAVKAMMHYERPKGYLKDAPEKGDGYKETVAFAKALLK